MRNSEQLHDPFAFGQIYPEAHPLLTWRLESLEQCIGDSLVVLDTNVLLLPYTVRAKSLSEIKEKFRVLAGQRRLRIPAQVAREFAKNRPLRLADLFHQIGTKKSKAQKVNTERYPLLEGLEEYRKATEIENEINALITDYQKVLSSVLDHVRRWNWNDPLSTLYAEILSSEVITEPDINPQTLVEDFAYRCANSIPPGYKDAAKDDSGIGDYLIWKTILHLGSTEKTNLVFVTGEQKADWWHQSGGAPLYPRYELVDEYRRASEGHSFHIVALSELLNLVGASVEAIEEVRHEEQEDDEWYKDPDLVLFSRIEADWPEIIQAVKRADPRVAALLMNVRPKSMYSDLLILQADFAFHRARILEPHNKALIEDVLTRRYGVPLDVGVQPIDRPQPSTTNEDPLDLNDVPF